VIVLNFFITVIKLQARGECVRLGFLLCVFVRFAAQIIDNSSGGGISYYPCFRQVSANLWEFSIVGPTLLG